MDNPQPQGVDIAALLGPIMASRRWIVATGVLVGCARHATSLEELGAAPPFLLAASRGTGDVREDLPSLCLDLESPSMMEGIRIAQRALDSLPARALRALDAYDPGREASVMLDLTGTSLEVAGRRVYGARDPRWVALEDKTIIHSLWDACGVARAPSVVVPLEAGALRAASRQLDRGEGTVWVGDNLSGWHGGASFLRWVRPGNDADAAQALAHLSTACATARVMPFLDGIPCSIHGIVFPDHVLALRPCEMIVLRHRDAPRLLYAAAGTYWDPPPADRETMRDIVRRVGGHLRESVDYGGVFTIDGVMTADGFRPTELNPRFGAAIGVMARGVPGLPLYLMHLAIVEGEALDWRPHQLEAQLLASADENRAARIGAIVDGKGHGPVEERLVYADLEWRRAADDESAHAILRIGPASAGRFVSAELEPGGAPIGESLAPRAVALFRYTDQHHATGIGALDAAPDLRR